MNMPSLTRRNRMKNRAKTEAPKRWVPKFVTEWRTYARRVSVLLLVVTALAGLSWALDRPIRVISMDGRFQRVSPGEIEKAVAPFTQAGFMSADLDVIQRAVESVPWVDHARVQRRWPNSLHVTVIEETAVARWDQSGLLNTRGQLFVREAAHVPAELPRLSGPDGTEAEVAERYLAAQGRMLEAGMRIAALRLDERGAWEIDLDNGVTVRLGRRDVDERLERFVHTASQVIAHRMNDFAIGWRTAQPQPPATSPASLQAKRADDAHAA
jgi:cell division protein FtsQ